MKLLMNSLSHFFQDNLETSIRGSDFISDSVQLIYCKFHKVNFKRGGSYIGSPGWLKKKSNNKSKK